jgi:hypothetical protein
MPGTKRETKGKAYRCVKGFSYPASLAVRDRIRGGEKVAIEDRGEWVRHVIGDRIANPPIDLIESWLRRGAVEPVGSAPKREEEPDGTQG